MSDHDDASTGSGEGSSGLPDYRRRAGQRLVAAHIDGAEIPDEARSEFWTLSRKVAGRDDDEQEIIDAVASLLHHALAKDYDPGSICLAATLHVEFETGQRLRKRPDDDPDPRTDRLGDFLVLLCLSNGKVWSEEQGWVEDLLDATLYSKEAARTVKVEQEDCLFAAHAQVGNLVEMKRIPVHLPSP